MDIILLKSNWLNALLCGRWARPLNSNQPHDRNKPTSENQSTVVDGLDKVTGKAKYAAEFDAPDLLHGYVVTSTIAKGKIKNINTLAMR